jgi:hypothetical protein
VITATAPRGVAIVCLAALTLAGCGGGGSSGASSSGASSSDAAPSVASSSVAGSAASNTTAASAATASSSAASAPASSARVSTSAAASGRPFTVTLPAGYKSEPSKASGVVIAFYAGPIVGNFTVNVNVTQEPAKGLSVKTAQREAVAGIKKVLKITKLSGASPVKLDGESALSYSFEDTQGGLHFKQGQVVVLHKSLAYVFTFTAPVAQFDKQSPKAEQLIKSLRFR